MDKFEMTPEQQLAFVIAVFLIIKTYKQLNQEEVSHA